MKYYRITAKLLSPLMIQQNRQAYAPDALPYLPGGTLRGALAAKYLRDGSPGDEAFRLLFLDQPVFFPDLLPAPDSKTLPGVLPMSAVSCKRCPGFVSQGKKEQHGFADMLALTAAGRLTGTAADQKHWECPQCREDMKPFSGFWNGNMEAPARFVPTLTSQRHTGISRTTGTVASSIFYMTQTIAEYYKNPDTGEYLPQYLSGGAWLNEEQIKCLTPLLAESVFAGADRTRGLGELEISVKDYPAPAPDMEKWDKEFRKKIRNLNKGQEIAEGIYFSVTLQSHAILTDPFLRPVSDIPELNIPDVEPVMKMVKSETVRGWQTAWGLAKPDDMAVSMGSVYLFRCKGKDRENLKNILSELLANGIGLRREEGYGRISVCDFLHIREGIL